MRRFNTILIVLAAGALFAGCSNDDDDGTPAPTPDVDYNRTYIQIERLGNPLTSEVFLAKRTHGAHNAVGPDQDNLFRAELIDFVATVGGRNTTVQNTLAAVLLPDELIVDTAKPANTAGWLTWALAAGYGGRALANDVVDGGLSAIFGDLLDPNNVTTCLTTDNVDANDSAFLGTFPYLAAPH
jgi:hypothetical protein